MPFPFKKVSYKDLNSRQKESHNFQKLSGVLADYGFVTIRLSDDWKGADFLAHHRSGETLRVQLKSRLFFDKKYKGQDLWICFRRGDEWYLYPHDELLKKVLRSTTVGLSKSWTIGGGYSFPGVSKKNAPLLAPYRIA